MNMLKKLFKKSLKPSTELKVCIVDEKSDDLHEVFGISSERKKELGKITFAAFHDNENSADSYVNIVEKCNHVNEIIVCTIIFERIKDKQNNPMHMLSQMFKNL